MRETESGAGHGASTGSEVCEEAGSVYVGQSDDDAVMDERAFITDSCPPCVYEETEGWVLQHQSVSNTHRRFNRHHSTSPL
ncbi:hypothetical protein PDJAM_G00260880 [Pangasius djambal]|nr:hypothetical protein [Pangasius djambal]